MFEYAANNTAPSRKYRHRHFLQTEVSAFSALGVVAPEPLSPKSSIIVTVLPFLAATFFKQYICTSCICRPYSPEVKLGLRLGLSACCFRGAGPRLLCRPFRVQHQVYVLLFVHRRSREIISAYDRGSGFLPPELRNTFFGIHKVIVSIKNSTSVRFRCPRPVI